MKKEVEKILLGDSKDKLQELKTLDKNGVPVLNILFEISMDFINNLKSILELNNAKSIEEITKEVRRIKTPVQSNDDMNKKLDELQEILTKINNSL